MFFNRWKKLHKELYEHHNNEVRNYIASIKSAEKTIEVLTSNLIERDRQLMANQARLDNQKANLQSIMEENKKLRHEAATWHDICEAHEHTIVMLKDKAEKTPLSN